MKNKFMDWFGLAAPILQAPIGGVVTVDMATAVGKAGGLGSLALSWPAAEIALSDARLLKAQKVPFFINFVMRFPNPALPLILDLGVPAITLSWGIDANVVRRIQTTGARAGVQVGSKGGAELAIAAGADFLIIQGFEAGGHVQSTTPRDVLLAEVLGIAGSTPVVAAGGIGCGADIARVLKNGAQAAMLGTSFVATKESTAHALYKQALVEATGHDTAFTNCFDIDWPFAMHRVLRNSTHLMWEAAGSPASPHRPGEGDIIATYGDSKITRYSDSPPPHDAKGDVLAACLYAGMGVDHIKTIESAGDLVRRLWADTQKLL